MLSYIIYSFIELLLFLLFQLVKLISLAFLFVQSMCLILNVCIPCGLGKHYVCDKDLINIHMYTYLCICLYDISENAIAIDMKN